MQIVVLIISLILQLLDAIGTAVLWLWSVVSRGGFITLHQLEKLTHRGLHQGKIAIRKTLRLRKHTLTLLRTKRRRIVVVYPLPERLKIRYFVWGAFFSILAIFLPLLLLMFLQNLPNPRELTTRQVPQTTKLYDRNGTLLYEMYAQQNRTLVRLTDIPKVLQEATIAIEDKKFYTHPGFDVQSMARAVREDLSGRSFQGASTITQQLIKSSLLTPEPSIIRKVKEIILAFWSERLYSKSQILEMYFNQVPYGGTAWGVEAASEVYFGKRVKELDLAQSTFLAGLTQAPTSYSPFSSNGTLWKRRQAEVLKQMVGLGYISQTQAATASKEQLTFNQEQVPLLAPHFVNYVKDLLVKRYGLPLVEKGGLSVTTSLDLQTQSMTQQIVTDEVNRDGYLNLNNGAAVVTNPQNGDIVAMVGSKDFNEPTFGKVNLATSLRQPGSSIKIVTYTASLMHGFTAASLIDDTPATFDIQGSQPYSPVNYDGRFHGRLPLRIALANSLNIPAVKVLNQIGVPTMVSLAKDMGVSSWGEPSEYGLSITLGAADVTMLDMATINGTLANMGRHIALNPILKISDSKGNTLEEKRATDGERVINPGVAYIMSDILADNTARSMEFGPASPLNIPNHFVSVKTGTTDSKRDNWTNGYTNNYVVITWVGNNDNTPMSQDLASGITGAAPIWNRIMTNLISQHAETKLQQPANVIRKGCYGRDELFLGGTENSTDCNGYHLFTPTPNQPQEQH